MRVDVRTAISTAIAASVIAAAAMAGEAPERGFVYAANQSGATQLLSEPRAGAKAVPFTPAYGSRLRYGEVAREGDRIAWYHVDTAGFPPWWLAAKDASATQPKPLPPGQKLPVSDIEQLRAHPMTAMTSAARGLDRRIAGFALAKAAAAASSSAEGKAGKAAGMLAEGDGSQGWALAVAHYSTLSLEMQRRYADVAGDGVRKDASGNVPVLGAYQDSKVADGRVRRVKEFTEGLK